MKSQACTSCDDLFDLLRAKRASAHQLREDSPPYGAHNAANDPNAGVPSGRMDELTYRSLTAVLGQLRVLQVLTGARASADSDAVIGLSRAAVADCVDRLSAQLSEVLEAFQADPR